LEPSPVYIYADESCLGNQYRSRANPGAAAGLVEQLRGEAGWHRKDFWYFEPDTTNNRMALLSGILGLEALRRPCDVVFTSDSQYLVRGMKEWIHAWARRGWRRKGGTIENLGLWQRLAREARRHAVEWRWVRGHAGHPQNEYAHALATRAAERRESSEGLVESGFEEWLRERVERGASLELPEPIPPTEFAPDPPPPEPPEA